MKNRYVFLLIISAAAAAAYLPSRVHGQDNPGNQAASGGTLGILQHGRWQCALPGDAGGDAYVPVPEEDFGIGTASGYSSAAGNGIYLLRGNEVVFTRGPKKDQRFRLMGANTLQKLNADGSLSRLICTRVSNGR